MNVYPHNILADLAKLGVTTLRLFKTHFLQKLTCLGVCQYWLNK